MTAMRGADALVACLERIGTTRVYGVIGTSIVGLLDGLYGARDRIRYISCRHEQVAASMADAEGRLTRRPGVVVLHSGPGALNAMISMANAAKDCSPLVAIAGTIKRRLSGCDGMLELDHARVFRPLCRLATRVETVAEIPQRFAEVYRAAMEGPGGPALLEVPEDLWTDREEVDFSALSLDLPAPPPANDAEVLAIARRLQSAVRPLILAGAGIAYTHSESLLREVVERWNIPVATTGNGRGVISELHPLSLGRAGYGGGNPVADEGMRRADLILAIGCTLSDMTSYEYTWPITADIIAINLDSDNDQKKIPVEATYADAADFLGSLVPLLGTMVSEPKPCWIDDLRGVRDQWHNLLESAADVNRTPVSPAYVCRRLGELLPEDAIVTVGAGMHLLYPMAFIPARQPRAFLSAVNFGAMGFGFPAALGAQVVFPDRTVVAVLGDGDFLMTVQDLETAVRERIGAKILVINDNAYRVLAFRQQVQYSGHVYGSTHSNPDFIKLAESFRLPAWRIERTEQVDPILHDMLSVTGPALVEIVTDPADIPPTNLEAAMQMSD
jgi:acetolactate synthase I/II/III large subunit